ncbi:penicillin acylase family protein [Pseudorhodobacter wandonensis]|uniref:penicillin acylase family protein n=1 Tax=Pseudorhodobacter wandonensis TaxID=1120568 RepID=UPI00067B9F3D|nr:penicillin acylase family protein [Pseudorhodobacter wandonensis]
MLLAFRWLTRIFVALLALGAVSLLIAYYFLSRSLPDYSASYQLSGISGETEIVRNNANVPHIFGPTDADVYFALGFAHAQDRLWQMTMLRRTAQGRLSEVFGERTLKTDELLRRYDLYTLASQSVDAQDDATKQALDAYSRGVNAWISEVNLNALGRGAPEFFFFTNEIATWQPADSIAILKLMALQLSGQLDAEVLRARTSMLLPESRLRDILPDAPGSAVTALPDYASLMPAPPPGGFPQREAFDPLSPFKSAPFTGASNAWAAAPERSAAGGSLLANDPHLNFTAPTLWYLARLQFASGGVIGATIPGVPAVLMGRSDSLGWGITSSYLDDQDVVMERVNPENTEQYDSGAGWKNFTTRRSIITVKDHDPVTITLRWSEAGPILPGSHYNLATVTPPGHVAALEWTALTANDTSMTSAIRLMNSNNIDEALAAGRQFVAPALNLMLADKDGIAFQLVGAVPNRDPAHETQGRMPATGDKPQNRWAGVMDYDKNLRIRKPTSGLLGNTNNKTTDAPFPDNISFVWGDTHRIQRWLTLMKTREVHTRESFIEAQLDTVSPVARAILPLIGADLWFTGTPSPAGTPERLREQALELLAAWNGEMNEHLPEPLIYAAWLRALQTRLIHDELGPLADSFTHPDPVFIERVFRDTDGASKWCDIIQSATIETCTDIARVALDDALLELSERYGPSVETWRWGDAHQATHDHPVLGNVPVLRYFVNMRQSTSGGDSTLMRGLTKGTGPDPYENVNGAGYRGVYDLADPDSSVFILSTGQSGHPLSRHYDDLGVLWRRGEYIPMSLDADLARAAAVGITHLSPAPK